MKYDDYNEFSGCEFIIPARQPDRAKKIYTIEKIEDRKKASGGSFPCMSIKDMEGNMLQIPAWTRDVSALCKDWGTDSDKWLNKGVYFSIKEKKMSLLPAPDSDIIPAEAVK